MALRRAVPRTTAVKARHRLPTVFAATAAIVFRTLPRKVVAVASPARPHTSDWSASLCSCLHLCRNPSDPYCYALDKISQSGCHHTSTRLTIRHYLRSSLVGLGTSTRLSQAADSLHSVVLHHGNQLSTDQRAFYAPPGAYQSSIPDRNSEQ